jgi:adenylate kinase
MKVIIVTGTPGTGKTTIAKQLANKYKYTYVDVNALISKHKLHEKYDRKFKSRIVDAKKLSTFLQKYTKTLNARGAVVDSHLSHHLPASFVDVCYVTTCPLKTLKQRLKKRGYSAQKIKDNLEAEAFQTCLVEAQEHGHRVMVKTT